MPRRKLNVDAYFDPPEDDQAREPGPDVDLPEPHPDFPTLTDCPYCGSRRPDECGCLD